MEYDLQLWLGTDAQKHSLLITFFHRTAASKYLLTVSYKKKRCEL